MITFTVAPEHGEKYKVVATSRDILNWERTTKGGSMKQLMEELHLGDLYKVAHFAAKRLSLTTETLKEFEANNDLEFETEDVDPTQSAR